jgi:fluoroquinolone resistance protein
MDFIVEKTFERIKFNETPIKLGDYENCIFKQCDFSNVKLSDIKFIECEFISCNLSLAKLERTAFRDIILENVKCWDFILTIAMSLD